MAVVGGAGVAMAAASACSSSSSGARSMFAPGNCCTIARAAASIDSASHAQPRLPASWRHQGLRLNCGFENGIENGTSSCPRRGSGSRRGNRRRRGVQIAEASLSGFSADMLVDAMGNPLSTGGGAMATQSPAMAQRSAEADVMGLMLRQRVVFLGNQVDDFVADAVVSQLLLLDAVDSTKDIRLFINCPGGAISAAMGIYDAIQLCRSDVSTIAFGLAASTAAIILAGGSKGKRFAMPNTRIMMHQPLGGASGQAIDVEIQAKEIMYHKSNISRIIAEITERPLDQVSKDMDRDRYMSPVEAMEYGLIDGVIDKDTIIPLEPAVEKVKQRSANIAALDDPRKFLNPDVPDSEIY